MDVDLLRKLLGRFKLQDVRQAVEEWGYVALEGEVFVGGGQKRAVVDRVIRACQIQGAEIGLEELAALDLVYMKMYSGNSVWNAYHLTGETRKRKVGSTVSPNELRTRLGEQLFLYFKHTLCVRQHNGTFWLWLMVQENSRPVWTPSNIVHMVYHPTSPYIFTSTIRAEYKEYIIQALLLALGYSKAQFMDLSGRDVESLGELATRRHSQRSTSSNQSDVSQAESQASRKRAKQDNKEPDNDVTQEDAEDKCSREEYATDTFGDKPQPKLEKVLYKLRASLKHGGIAPNMDDQPFEMTVKFTGSNVLEGMRALSAAGIAEPPLPSYLESLPYVGKNSILLAERKKSSSTDDDDGRSKESE